MLHSDVDSKFLCCKKHGIARYQQFIYIPHDDIAVQLISCMKNE